MKQVLKFDENGYLIGPILIGVDEDITTDCTDVQVPSGLFKPKWNGIEWIEGLQQEEINAIKNKPRPKTEFEILKETVDMLVLSGLEGN